MKPRLFASAARLFLPLLSLVSLCLFSPSMVRGEGILPATMPTYCAEPPFAAAGIKSNLLLMLDNSGSMYDLAYINPAALTNPSTYCLDDSFQDSKTYSGYFEPDAIYRYQTDRFVPVATLSSCSTSSCVSTGYLYLQMTSVAPVTVTAFEARGNFLNWLSMSKLDIQKKVLTGGKFVPDAGDPGKGVLQAESRGCQGKRFVKMINGLNLTFAVRGPSVEDVGFVMQLSRGGGTLIEVFPGSYQKKECLEAIDAWRAGNRDTLMAKANNCMNATRVQGSPPSAGWLFSRIMGHCYDFLESNKAVEFDQGLKDGCLERWKYLFGLHFDVEQIRAVDGICGRGQQHRTGDGQGFLGSCYNSAGRGTIYPDDCVHNEMIDYCNEIRTPFLIDPPSAVDLGGAKGNIAKFILDAGIYYLGRPAGVFNARVDATAPVGLVQMFSNSINFGAMIFNANGAAGAECDAGLICVKHCSNDPAMECTSDYECMGGTCAGSDGGRVVSYINDPLSPPGDHASGLVHAIDGIAAGAYTPYAEAFYNAIGYYAQRSDLRIAETDFDLGKPVPSQYSCQRNNILIISDGMSTADSKANVEQLASLYSAGRGTATGRDASTNTPPQQGSRSLDDLAWIASHRNIREFSTSVASTEAPATSAQSITTHVIFTGVSNGAPGEADPATLMRRTAESGGGVFVTASDPAALNAQLLMVLRQAAHGTSSGTSPTIHSGGSGNGALFLQERYYPKKSFDGDSSATWIGEMQGLWYYIDPFRAGSSGRGSTIREDTVRDSRLNLANDRVVTLGNGTVSAFYDRNGDGNRDQAAETLPPDAVAALLRAGRQLWSRNLATAPRRIFTPLLPNGVEAGSTGLMHFSLTTPDHSDELQPYLQASTAADAAKLMKYVQGFDFPGETGMRSRTVRIGNIPASSSTESLYVTNPRDKGIGVWKLGDIISSAAKVQSAAALSSYDLPAPRGYGDRSYGSYLKSNQYGNRGMIYLGANDGMLHAFKMGKVRAGTGGETAVLEAAEGVTPGDEAWAFIPRNVLPYLTYLKEPAYQHLYLMDGAVTLADASIGDTGSGGCVASSYWSCPKPASVVTQNNDLDPSKNTWRTVLIGSMGLGGASWSSCSDATDPAETGAPCVPTPIADPANPSKRVGYSSYFALDVTDPANPSFLWEFSHPDLGYSTTGPAIVRVGDPKSNGRWFAVFGSGPTGRIRDQQFLGESNRELKFFVVDLRTGQLVTTIATGVPNAFAGSISGGVIDDRKTRLPLLDGGEMRRASYQDDAIYVGYTAFDEGSKRWTGGGVGRIMIGDLPVTAQPEDSMVRNIWSWSRVIDSTGPVTTSIVRLQDNRSKSLWLYFGTGRYYYRSFQQDDFSGQRSIFGVREPCYANLGSGYLDKSCSKKVCDGTKPDCLTNQTTSVGTVDRGWRIDLDAAKDELGAERVINDPVSMTAGAVFFPTFRPSASACSIGNSYLWGVRYDTGDAIPAGWLQGKVLMQLSTGELKETALGELEGKRRISAMPDSRPGGIKIVTNSGLRPLKKIIHMQER